MTKDQILSIVPYGLTHKLSDDIHNTVSIGFMDEDSCRGVAKVMKLDELGINYAIEFDKLLGFGYDLIIYHD